MYDIVDLVVLEKQFISLANVFITNLDIAIETNRL